MAKILVEIPKGSLSQKAMTNIFETFGLDYVFKHAKEITEQDISECDTLFALRPCSIYSLTNAENAKNCGLNYIAQFDDHLISKEYPFPLRRKHALSCIKLADCICSPNKWLAQEYAKLSNNHKYFYSDTAVAASELIPPADSQAITKFVYATGPDHLKDFNKIIMPILPEILEKYGDRFHMTFMGIHPDTSKLGYPDNFDYVEGMPYDEYINFMLTHRFDVGIAPVSDTEFSHGKYYNKYIEYSKMGVVGIYTNCLPYTLAIINGETGILTANDKESWFDAFEKCIKDNKYVKKLANAAFNDIKENYSVGENNAKYEKELMPLLSTTKGCNKNHSYIKINWIKRKAYDIFDAVCLVLFQLKSSGLKGTIKKIKVRL